jgi:UDP-N-acetylmuramate dehydrogenase
MPSTWPNTTTINMKEWPAPTWFDALPAGAADYRRNIPLADYTTIAVGGPAEVWAEVRGWDGLAALVAWCHGHGIMLTLVGKGSNLMVRDGGIAGVVAHISKGFDAVEVDGTHIYAEAGAACGTVARAAREAELEGLAFFGGIPGSVGGALRMNAGAYGGETFADLQDVWVIDCAGETKKMHPADLKPRYRGTELPDGWVYKAGRWALRQSDKEIIRKQMQEINRARSSTQPLHMPSSGSWFKNPVLAVDGVLGKAGEKVNAWRVVEAAGCRGLRVGGAMVSEQHANFFVNVGAHEKGVSATSADFEALSVAVEAAVLAKLGITIEREVRWVGVDSQP